MDDQLLSEFLAEAEDLIEELHGDIAALRARRSQGRARRELVGRIFRRVHTIKGTASAAGLAGTSHIAHELEALLDAVRLGRTPVDDSALDAAEDAVAAIAASLDAVVKGEPAASPDELIERLRRLSSDGGDTPRTGEADAEELLPAEVARALGEYERQRLREAVREGAMAYVVAAEFGLETFDEEFRRLSDALSEFGEVVAAQPTVDAEAPERVGFRIIYASEEARERLSERVTQLGARLWRERKGSIVDEGAYLEGAYEEQAALRPHASAHAALVRVPLDALDDIISTTRELSALAASVLDLALRASESGGVGREESETRAALVRSRFSELEARLIGLRMEEARVALERAARAGRSAARASGKQVEFEIEGGNVRLDKSLADRIADPLLHIVRNAVAHGIETTEERRAAGKSERGRVRLEAVAEGDRLVLRVSDDGRGVDAGLISEAASERGIIAAGATLSDAQALRLIFRPGFSTTARASLVSGRGVGLDVVERAVEDAGGEVRVQTAHGRGTTFELRLPTPPVRDARLKAKRR
ncbi:MAG TPA: ATP-binding protein [Pyrinomonadaceae bacterium]|nr:ATP-binding protein [Pyrinomonadaceae bacterium]